MTLEELYQSLKNISDKFTYVIEKQFNWIFVFVIFLQVSKNQGARYVGAGDSNQTCKLLHNLLFY